MARLPGLLVWAGLLTTLGDLAVPGYPRGHGQQVPRPNPSTLHAGSTQDAEIAKLIRQLGSDRFAERDAAEKRLEAIGEAALDALRPAAQSADPEVSRRARRLVELIPDRQFQRLFEERVPPVAAILPKGWAITQTRAGSTPTDWHTVAPTAGFLVEARNGNEWLRIWFLPRDWIGIRKSPNQAPRTCYWEGILAGPRYKTITAASDDALQERVSQLVAPGRLSTPSLVNGGYRSAMELFGTRAPKADAAAARLIREHSRTLEQFAEAAHSLVVLGIPARSVFLRGVREVQGMDRDLFCSALGLLGGEDAIGVLCAIAADRGVPEERRKYAVLALERHRDPRIPLALHAGLRGVRDDGELLERVARVLASYRYRPAAPDLLAVFQRLPATASSKPSLAAALAALGNPSAVPELRRWLQTLRQDPRSSPELLRSADLALLRLTGDWGQPGEGLRVCIVPPARAVVGQRLEVTIHQENIAGERLSIMPHRPDKGILLDGAPLAAPGLQGVWVGGIVPVLDPGEVRTLTYDLAAHIKTPGEHVLQYEFGEARSAVVRFRVRAAGP